MARSRRGGAYTGALPLLPSPSPRVQVRALALLSYELAETPSFQWALSEERFNAFLKSLMELYDDARARSVAGVAVLQSPNVRGEGRWMMGGEGKGPSCSRPMLGQRGGRLGEHPISLPPMSSPAPPCPPLPLPSPPSPDWQEPEFRAYYLLVHMADATGRAMCLAMLAAMPPAVLHAPPVQVGTPTSPPIVEPCPPLPSSNHVSACSAPSPCGRRWRRATGRASSASSAPPPTWRGASYTGT